jgi:heme exporter protein A
VSGSAALELRGVARRFGQRWALRGIDLDAGEGQIVALTGRNGSGKTTLLRICATLLRPTRGSGRLFGHDIVRDADLLRGRVGFLAHETGLYGNLTASENLVFAMRMAGMVADAAAIHSVLAEVGLAHEQGERVRGFSSGMRRRLALARLLLRPPDLLLLDEPYASFDAEGIERVNAFASSVAAAGGIVLVATHDLRRAEQVLHREARLENGRVVEERDRLDPALATLPEGET